MLRITEIFASVQGETSYSGYPFAFVRLTGCNLRCRYCDTTYAYDAGEEFPLEEVVSRVTAFGLTRACVTGGGAPLLEEAPALVAAVLERGREKERGILLSPVFGFLAPEKLAGWMVGDGLDARFQLQLHKLVWGPDRGGGGGGGDGGQGARGGAGGEYLKVPARRRLVVDIGSLTRIGGPALTDAGIDVPKADLAREGIPVTYVPFRNAHLVAIAVSWAEVIGAKNIYIGAVAVDSSGYPDCRPEFFEAMGVPFERSWSCYREGEKACGTCDSCALRLRAFAEAGVPDPLPYETRPDYARKFSSCMTL